MYFEKYFTFSKNPDHIKIAQVEKMSTQLGNVRTKNRKKTMQDYMCPYSNFLQLSSQ